MRVLTQTARTLATPANVVRAVEAVTAKPETASTVTVADVSVKQVASIVSGIRNVHLEQSEIESVIGTDLRLSINGGLDKLVLDTIATAGFQAPGTDLLLVSIRKAMTTLFAAGYNPDTLILTPANSEALDTLVSGISGGTADFVFGPGRFAPGTLYGMNVRVSKTIPARRSRRRHRLREALHQPDLAGHVRGGRGSTNTSTVRLEGHAVFGTERVTAAVRIAAS